jgi:phosphatidylserine decarboxylase
LVIYGIYYAAGLLVGAGVVTYLTNWYWALPFYILAIFCLYFFRDPDREVPPGPVAVSPADGKVVVVKPENGGQRISIFLNVFDVHVNRTPIPGLIARRIICYKKPGDTVAAGERVGLIKFGSRVDVELGPEWEVTVRVGQRVSAGSSVIARKKS